MSGFSRNNTDVIDLGTAQISGVTCRLQAANRTPWDGAVAGALAWNNATAYVLNDVVVRQGHNFICTLAHTNQDPSTDTTNHTVEYGTYWKSIDGKDGDVWFQVSGGTSNTYQKVNNTWVKMLKILLAGGGIALSNSASNALAFNFDKAVYKSAIIDYFIVSGTDIERGQMNIINDGTVGVAAVHGTQYNINQMGTDLQVSFLFNTTATNVEVRYNSSATPTGRILYYLIRQ